MPYAAHHCVTAMGWVGGVRRSAVLTLPPFSGEAAAMPGCMAWAKRIEAQRSRYRHRAERRRLHAHGVEVPNSVVCRQARRNWSFQEDNAPGEFAPVESRGAMRLDGRSDAITPVVGETGLCMPSQLAQAPCLALQSASASGCAHVFVTGAVGMVYSVSQSQEPKTLSNSSKYRAREAATVRQSLVPFRPSATCTAG